MPEITWICEECVRRKQGGLRPPKGWLEVSYWDGLRNKFHRHSFCSYSCAAAWCSQRYEVMQEEK